MRGSEGGAFVAAFAIRRCRAAFMHDRLVSFVCWTTEGVMLHHLSLGVADLERAAAFYDAVLAALGCVRVWSDATAIGYGPAGGGDKLAIKLVGAQVAVPGPRFHVAFAAPSRKAVMDFHAEALKHGGRDNGRPGLRLDYGKNYYAAFVIDPDGHPIEAVIDR